MSSVTVPEFGPNDWFVEEKYNQFLSDPTSVDQIWRDFFTDPVAESRRLHQAYGAELSLPTCRLLMLPRRWIMGLA